jgi:hypothetical protein
MDEMVRRRDGAQATLDRFKDVPLRLGRNDCVRMAAYHLRKLGHKVKLPPSGSYNSAKAGKRLLSDLGHASLAEAVDAHGLERIAPAAAVVGDIVMLPGEEGLGALTVCMGNGRVVGYHQDARGAVVMQPTEFEAAWRV